MMKRSDLKRHGISFGALDAFIIVLVLVALLGIFARSALAGENGVLATAPEMSDAAVSLLITDIEGTSSLYFVLGNKLTIAEYGVTGSVMSDFTVTPAEYFVENENGELIVEYHDEENGHIDLRGALLVSGYYKDGVYILDGKTPFTAGMEITLENETIKVKALVTDVAPIS